MPTYVTSNTHVFAQVDVDPSQVTRLLSMMELNVSHPGLAVFLEDDIDPFIRTRIDERFAAEGDDAVGAWAPLLSTTEALRASKGFPPAHPINQRTHMMHNFLVGTHGDVKASSTDATLTYPGPGVDALMGLKLKAAQAGKSYPQTVPRPVLGFSDTDELYIHTELVRHILSGL